jgi:hypothetical protein
LQHCQQFGDLSIVDVIQIFISTVSQPTMSVNDINRNGVDQDLRMNQTFEILEILLICNWLNLSDLCLLDITVSNRNFRRPWLNILKSHPIEASTRGAMIIRRLGG